MSKIRIESDGTAQRTKVWIDDELQHDIKQIQFFAASSSGVVECIIERVESVFTKPKAQVEK